MKRSAIFSAATAIGLMASLGSVSAKAGTLVVTWTEATRGIDVSWEQSSTPTPNYYGNGIETDVPVWNFTSTGSTSVGPYSAIEYLNGALTGMFYTPGNGYIVDGPQIYSGSESAPIFTPGTYTGQDELYGSAAQVTVAEVTSVPEASTWGMMLLGFAGLTLGAYRRQGARAA